MVIDGYGGDAEAYIEDYAGDYEVTTRDGVIIVSRKGYDENYAYIGGGFIKVIQ
jgi:hypothetical protein